MLFVYPFHIILRLPLYMILSRMYLRYSSRVGHCSVSTETKRFVGCVARTSGAPRKTMRSFVPRDARFTMVLECTAFTFLKNEQDTFKAGRFL